MDGVENQERLVSFPQGMWCGCGCATILESLEGELAGQGGLVIVTGVAGVGKSLLLDCYTKYLKKTEQTYYFMSGGELREIDFFNVLASGLSIQGLYAEKLHFIVEFSNYLYSLADRGKKLTLVIDDCELLSQDILDVLRLIVQVEKDGIKLVQLILVGHKKFVQTLAKNRNKSLLSCLIYNSTLEPFSQQETAEYISYRLDIAGQNTEVFGFNSLHLIHRATGGRVGEINRLCEHVLRQPPNEKSGGYNVSALCNSIDALSMKMESSAVAEDTSLPPVSKKVEQQQLVPLAKQQKVNWAEAVQVAAMEAQQNGLQTNAETQKITRLRKILMGKKSKKWWMLTAPTCVALGLCLYLVVPLASSKDELINPEKAVKNNTLLQGLVDELVDDKAIAGVTESVIETTPRAIGRKVTGEGPSFAVETGHSRDELVTPVFPLAEDVAVEPKSPPEPMRIPEEMKVSQEKIVEAVASQVQEKALLPAEPFVQVMRLKAGTNALAGGARTSLNNFLTKAQLFPQAQIVVKGYVSSNTTSQENTAISVKRAGIVRDMLIEKGISAERIRVIGMGVQSPVANNSTISGRNKNRRAVLELLPKEYTKPS